MNTRHRVIEVQMMIQIDTMANDASGFSLMANDMGAPMTHRMNTLYTDIPMYLQTKTSKGHSPVLHCASLLHIILRMIGERVLKMVAFSLRLYLNEYGDLLFLLLF